MKIGFIGTGATGKTTLAQLIEKETKLPYVRGVTRMVMQRLGLTETSQYTMTPQEVWELQKAAWSAKIIQDHATVEGVFDRTPIDHFAYCIVRCAGAGQMREPDFEQMYKEMATALQKYDVLCYFPIYPWPKESDGLRDENGAARRSVDIAIQGLITSLGLEDIVMRQDNVPPAERLAALRIWAGVHGQRL